MPKIGRFPTRVYFRMIAIPVLLALCAVAVAVDVPYLGEVEIHVATDRSEPAPAATEVSITGAGATKRAMADASGNAEFFRVREGYYNVTVRGPGISETVQENVYLGGGRETRLTVYAHLRPHEPGAPATVAVSQLSVPYEAKKELEKGNQLLRKGKLSEAAAHCRRAIGIFPAFADAHNTLGVIAIKQAGTSEARAEFLKALEFAPSHHEANSNLARLALMDQDWEEGERLALRSIKSNPQDPKPLVLLTVAQLNLGKLDDAAASARRVHAIAPLQYPISHYLGATSLRLLGRWQEAIVEYQTYLEELPSASNAAEVRMIVTKLQEQAVAAPQ